MSQYWPATTIGVLILFAMGLVVYRWKRRPSTGMVSQRISRISGVTVAVGFTMPLLVPAGPQWWMLTAGLLLLVGVVGLAYGQVHRKVEEHQGRRLRAQMGLSARRRRLPAWLVGGLAWLVTVGVVVGVVATMRTADVGHPSMVLWLLIVPLAVGLAAAWGQDIRRELRDRQIDAEDRAAAGGLEHSAALAPVWVPRFARAWWVDWQRRLDAPVSTGREWWTLGASLGLLGVIATVLVGFGTAMVTAGTASLREEATQLDVSGLFIGMVVLACLTVGGCAVVFLSDGWRTAVRQLRALAPGRECQRETKDVSGSSIRALNQEEKEQLHPEGVAPGVGRHAQGVSDQEPLAARLGLQPSWGMLPALARVQVRRFGLLRKIADRPATRLPLRAVAGAWAWLCFPIWWAILVHRRALGVVVAVDTAAAAEIQPAQGPPRASQVKAALAAAAAAVVIGLVLVAVTTVAVLAGAGWAQQAGWAVLGVGLVDVFARAAGAGRNRPAEPSRPGSAVHIGSALAAWPAHRGSGSSLLHGLDQAIVDAGLRVDVDIYPRRGQQWLVGFYREHGFEVADPDSGRLRRSWVGRAVVAPDHRPPLP